MEWYKSYVSTLSDGLSQLCAEDAFADVTVEVEGKHFKCHKVLLSAFSAYFRAMFTSQMKECTENKVSLPFLERSTFELVLDFIYHGKNVVNKDSVTNLLKAANFMQIDLLEKKCCEKIVETLTTDSCLEIWDLAKTLSCEHLEKEVFSFMLKNFPKLALNGVLVDHDELSHIGLLLKSGSVNLPDEDIITDLILNWIKKCPDRRNNSSLSYASKILRLPFTSPEYLFQQFVKKHSDLLDLPEISTLLEEAKEYHGMPARQAMYSSLSTSQRPASAFDDVIALIGGARLYTSRSGPATTNAMFPCKEVYGYSPRNRKWFSLAPLPFNMYHGGSLNACTYGQSDIYAFGGSTNRMVKYSGLTNTWVELKRLSFRVDGTTYSSMVAFSKSIYIVGGKQGPEMAGIYEYNICTDSWSRVGNLVVPVIFSGVAVSNSQILIFGGRFKGDSQTTPPTFVASKCIQSFDPRSKETVVLSDSAVQEELQKGVCKCYGFDSNIIVGTSKTVYHFKEENATLEEIAKISDLSGRYQFSMVKHREKIYVVSGHKVNEGIACRFTCYDMEDESNISISVPYNRVDVGCCKILVKKEFLKAI